MFDQVDATFQNGLNKHINDVQQQFNSMHSPVAIALRVCVLLICIVVGCRSSISMCFVLYLLLVNYASYFVVYLLELMALACCINLVRENV